MTWTSQGFRAGDWVEVKPIEEILDTLDSNAELDGLPFMPEMAGFCGKRFQIYKSAHKTCDTIHKTGGRRMEDAVHLLGGRCNGAEHDGCQANCLIFWKHAWLRPVDGRAGNDATDRGEDTAATADSGSAQILHDAACREDPGRGKVYSCQATRLFDATSALSGTRFTQYVADVRSGNFRFLDAIRILTLAGVYNLRFIGIGYNASVKLYEWLHRMLRHSPPPKWIGDIPSGQKTPDERLHLGIGEEVEVKSMDEILLTLNDEGLNRGLSFDAEMVPYCGKRFRVADSVEKIIDENTGEMAHFSNPCIVLDGVLCNGEYSVLRLMCPRKITPYWREIWLRRVEKSEPQTSVAS